MGLENEKIFAQPSLRHGTILNKLSEKVEIGTLSKVQEHIMGSLWNPMLHDLTDLFEKNEVTVSDTDINDCKPEKRYFEGLAVRLPRLLIQYSGFDANFRVVLTLCPSLNHPKIWSSYSMVSYMGENGGFDAETTRKFFDYFLPLAQKIAAVNIHLYVAGMKAEGLDAEEGIKHSFDVRTVGIKKEKVKEDLAALSFKGSAYIDELVNDHLKFKVFEECFKYLPPEIVITKKRDDWFGLNFEIGDKMADFLYHRTSTDNGKSNTYIVGVCQNLGRKNNAPSDGSGRLVRALCSNI